MLMGLWMTRTILLYTPLSSIHSKQVRPGTHCAQMAAPQPVIYSSALCSVSSGADPPCECSAAEAGRSRAPVAPLPRIYAARRRIFVWHSLRKAHSQHGYGVFLQSVAPEEYPANIGDGISHSDIVAPPGKRNEGRNPHATDWRDTPRVVSVPRRDKWHHAQDRRVHRPDHTCHTWKIQGPFSSSFLHSSSPPLHHPYPRAQKVPCGRCASSSDSSYYGSSSWNSNYLLSWTSSGFR